MKAAAVLLGTAALAPGLAACSRSNQPEPKGYDSESRPIAIPEIYEGKMVDGVRKFELVPQKGEAELLSGVTTPTWGFNGAILGPTLLMRKGDDIQVDITNQLDEMTTIHWHGMKIPAWADGGPHSPIEPGETWSPKWTVEQPAGTLWYHPHPHGITGLHCYRGLAGMLIVEDEVSDKLNLPKTYGVDDIPVVITDQKFNEDGTLNEELDDDLGLKGDTPLVNGQANVHFDATTQRLRMRVIGGATMRFYNLVFDDHRPFHIVATDSGFLSEPIEVEYVLVGPGERYEIVVDLKPGEEVKLRSEPLDGNFGIPDDNPDAADFGFQDTFDLLKIRVAEDAAPAAGDLPSTLDTEQDYIPKTDGAIERDFDLNTFEINGQTMDMNRVDITIDHDRPEIWRVTNENPDWPHNFHIHNSRFKVLGITNTEVPHVAAYGWKDTVSLPPGATAELAVEFGYYPDPTVPYMYHCHMLWHEDSGMMGQFVVVEPGQKAALKPMSGHGPHHA